MLIDGVATRSCSVAVSDAVGRKITTIEGLAEHGVLHKVQKRGSSTTFHNAAIASGLIMAVAALLNDKSKPTDAEIDEAITNICRCGTFQQARAAIHAAASA